MAAIMSATIAHLIAFPLGFAAYTVWRRVRAGNTAMPTTTAPVEPI
jgi:hypothetical protein